MKITVTNDSPITGTTRELAKRMKCDYQQANQFLKVLESSGVATNQGKRTPEGGRGKPSTIWEVPAGFSFDISESPV